MTAFQKNLFNNDHGWVTYGPDRKFVARFKYAPRPVGTFINFLIKNFSMEEYFGRLDKGESPLPILESKGYVMPHIKKWLKEAGLPPTQAGYRIWLDRRTAETVKRLSSPISDAIAKATAI